MADPRRCPSAGGVPGLRGGQATTAQDRQVTRLQRSVSSGSSDMTWCWLRCCWSPATIRSVTRRQSMISPICSSGTPRMWYIAEGSKTFSPSSRRWSFQRWKTVCGSAVQQPAKTRPTLALRSQEGSVGGRPDGNVVGMPEDSVRTEGRDHGWLFLVEDLADRVLVSWSSGTWSTAPSRNPSHSWRSGDRPTARQASSPSCMRIRPSDSRVAGKPGGYLSTRRRWRGSR